MVRLKLLIRVQAVHRLAERLQVSKGFAHRGLRVGL
jgi:hypothetical protein